MERENHFSLTEEKVKCPGIKQTMQRGNVPIALAEKLLILAAGNGSTMNGTLNATEKIESSYAPNGVLPNKHSLSSVISLKVLLRALIVGEPIYTMSWSSITLRPNSAHRPQRVELGMNSIVS